ncbi:anti-sigma factor domain-containing protein [Bacillus suaedae]|uniref:RsgI N-terminal anti-sigma domain-containing protein n=1 Tax=Halalkalibacter suaedae TaxID=2822140 RepID=A0A940X0N2_9BACI|nr:hypothetical protein [Bacillus suaedae]MBP3953055.1 hypothetical protein [Bacillus suaedae]
MIKQRIEGVIIKVTDNQCVVLSDDGTFQNVPLENNEYPLIGERITYQKKTTSSFPFKMMVLVASLFVTSLLTYSLFYNNHEPHYVAVIDINPSIEIFLDQDYRVLDVVPLNSDASKLMESIETEDSDLYTMVANIVTNSIAKGYLKEDENGILNASIIDLKNESEQPSVEHLSETINEQLLSNNISADVQVFSEGKDFYDQANSEDVSVNKYRMFQILKSKGIAEELVQVQGKSVKQLQEMIVNSVESNSSSNKHDPSKSADQIQDPIDEDTTPIQDPKNSSEKKNEAPGQVEKENAKQAVDKDQVKTPVLKQPKEKDLPAGKQEKQKQEKQEKQKQESEKKETKKPDAPSDAKKNADKQDLLEDEPDEQKEERNEKRNNEAKETQESVPDHVEEKKKDGKDQANSNSNEP